MSTFLFASQIPAELANISNEAIISAIESTSMTGVKISEASANFGKKVMVASAPALPVGVSFMIVKPLTVDAIARDGSPTSYDAFAVLLSTGETRVIPVTSILNPWIAKSADMTDGQKNLFVNHPQSLSVIDAFHRSHDSAKIANSYAAGFNLESSLDFRMKALSGVVTVTDAQSFEYSGVRSDSKEAFSARQRLYAFTVESADAKVKAFTKKVTDAKKA